MSSITKSTIKQLEYFIAVADVGHFRNAAKQLNVSQPTLTSQIAALEQTINQKLFERSSQGTYLSVTGKQLLPQARRAVEEMNAFIEQAIHYGQGYNSNYELGVSPTLGPYFLPHVLKPLKEKYRALQLFVKENVPKWLIYDLIDGKHDLVIAPLPVTSPELTVEPLFVEPLKLVVYANHPFTKKKSISVEELANENILMIADTHPMYHTVKQVCDETGAQTLRDYQGTSLDALRQMVFMEMGITFLPSLYIHSELEQRSDLKVVKIHDRSIYRTLALTWRKTSPSRNFYRDFAQQLRKVSKAQLGKHIELVKQ